MARRRGRGSRGRAAVAAAFVVPLVLAACTASRATTTVDAIPVPADDLRRLPRHALVASGRHAERIAGFVEGSGLFTGVRIGEAPLPEEWFVEPRLFLVAGSDSGSVSPLAALLLFLVPTETRMSGVVEVGVTAPTGGAATLTWDFDEERTLWLFAPLLRLSPEWSSSDGEQGDAFARALAASGLLTPQ